LIRLLLTIAEFGKRKLLMGVSGTTSWKQLLLQYDPLGYEDSILLNLVRQPNSEKQLGTNNSKVVLLGMTTWWISKSTQTMRRSLQALATWSPSWLLLFENHVLKSVHNKDCENKHVQNSCKMYWLDLLASKFFKCLNSLIENMDLWCWRHGIMAHMNQSKFVIYFPLQMWIYTPLGDDNDDDDGFSL